MASDGDERTLRRWAQRLHDEPLQGIGAVRMRLAAARRGPEEELPAAVDDAIDGLAAEIGVLRSLIAELRPAVLDELGIAAALRGLIAHHTEAGLEVELEESVGLLDETPAELGPEVEITIFRIVQEALSNVARHAGARRAKVQLLPAVGGISLEIEDDGAGFDLDAPATGDGLRRLGERLDLLGGTLRVRSQSGAGTTLRARLPLAGTTRAVGDQPLASPSIKPRSSA